MSWSGAGTTRLRLEILEVLCRREATDTLRLGSQPAAKVFDEGRQLLWADQQALRPHVIDARDDREA